MEYLIIDPSTRKIAVPKSEQLFGVYGEGNFERKYFKCPKIVGDNVGLSDCYIFVNYYTAKGLPGKYTVKDVNVDGENITFSWELKQHIFDANEDTSIYFAVEAKSKDKVEVFRTRPATGNAKETIDTDKEIEETHADVILDLISRVDTLEKEPISEEQIEKSVKSYLEKNPIEETDPTVPEWAKAEEKPAYTAEEVGALPSTTVIPSKLSASWFDSYVIKACITSGIQMQEYIPNNVSKWTTAIETAITSYSIVAQNGNFASGTVYIIGR